MIDPSEPPPHSRSCFEILLRYVFLLFLAATFWYLRPDKTQPRVHHEYEPSLRLVDAEHYHSRRCVPVTGSKHVRFAEHLIYLAGNNSFPVLTAAHVGERHCLLVTKLLTDDGRYEVLLNPSVLSTEGPLFVKIKSILCRRSTQRKKLYTRLRFTYQNSTDPAMNFSASSPDPDAAAQLFQAFEILNGTFRCS
jgi:hypothetical protein